MHDRPKIRRVYNENGSREIEDGVNENFGILYRGKTYLHFVNKIIYIMRYHQPGGGQGNRVMCKYRYI